ncbi:protein MAIN-LIKE 1-like [Cryptomeria japonica]|uniref:protein MAIN-LIKE 1-like n=1 Tax=Cryptomeria japonica TaxID=3369 RepID=UPI0027DA425B|nr:protein MAIN-LIKE 1-like [Cryptomeria japonica]
MGGMENIGVLYCRQSRPSGLDLRDHLLDEDVAHIRHLGLYHVLHLREITTNRALITALVERWHFETCTFHLPTSEASITLEDVWRILHIPIHGDRVVYDHDDGIAGLCALFECDEQDL